MNVARIAELLEPFLRAPIAASEDFRLSGRLQPCHSQAAKPVEEAAILSAAQLRSILTYIDILLRWNARINLTAIRDPEEIVTRHFGESLFAARHLFCGLSSLSSASGDCPEPSGRVVKTFEVADVGSGAGFPGVPIKIWWPAIHLSLIESNHKKCTFLREVTRALTLTDVNIQNTRAETLPPATFNVVTLRAVEHLESVLPFAASLLAPGGRLTLLIGSAQQNLARSTLPNLSWLSPSALPDSRSRRDRHPPLR